MEIKINILFYPLLMQMFCTFACVLRVPMASQAVLSYPEFWKQKYIQATSDLESAKKSFETEALFAGDAVKQSVKQLERKLQVRLLVQV